MEKNRNNDQENGPVRKKMLRYPEGLMPAGNTVWNLISQIC